jgi:RNA polymerase sigma-70 factor (sigma-E family)
VRRRQARTRAEFDRFVTESAEGLLRTASLMTWDVPAAEDLVQECLLRVSRQWPRVRAMEHPKAFARTVLVNLALNDGPRRSRHRAELNCSGHPHVDDHEDDRAIRVLGRVEASVDLTEALAELPPRQRIALVLRYFDDMSEVETADVMGCSVGTVKSTTSRALERLRELMDRHETGQETEGSVIR